VDFRDNLSSSVDWQNQSFAAAILHGIFLVKLWQQDLWLAVEDGEQVTFYGSRDEATRSTSAHFELVPVNGHHLFRAVGSNLYMGSPPQSLCRPGSPWWRQNRPAVWQRDRRFAEDTVDHTLNLFRSPLEDLHLIQHVGGMYFGAAAPATNNSATLTGQWHCGSEYIEVMKNPAFFFTFELLRASPISWCAGV